MTTVDKLISEYREKKKKLTPIPDKLNFEGVSGYDVYNITAPFESNGQLYIAGRVEKRESEHSKVYFFKKTAENHWIVDQTLPVFTLQDPFVTFIDEELVFGGVEIFESEDNPSILKWRTVFYKGETIDDLTRFFEGPMGMKDVRLKQLKDKRILVLTRPQGLVGGRGKIGAAVVENLSSLTIEAIERAVLFNELFIEEEWGGANEMHLLDKNTVGVLSHIAKFDEEDNRHYYAAVFELNIDTLTPRNLKIIAERKEFLPGPSKRPDLEDVIFSGGMVREDGEAVLYAGVSDAQAQKLKISDPFV